ncbi:unnamed protein product [Ectocarpus fasciculatus]
MVEWRALFPLAAKALGAAAVAAGVMAASLPGFGVGFSICAEICKAFTEWTSTSSEFKASVEVARKMKEALQDTLDLEDERIANAQYSRNTTYKRSVESNSQLLRILLDRQSERMRKELLKRSTTQSHKDTMMEDMLGELLDRQAKVMKAYTNEKILYQLKSLSSRINPNRGGGNGAPTPSTATGSVRDEEDEKDEEPDEEDDYEDFEDGDEDDNSAHSWRGFGGQESP